MQDYVTLESVSGDETTIINAARVSTSDTHITTLDDRDIRLLHYLQDNRHGTPFEHVTLRFRIKAPIFVLRQWMRHRIGTFNEYSQRYRVPMTEVYTPEDMPDRMRDEYKLLVQACTDFYERWYNEEKNESGNGRLREQLRCIMPVATYSEVVWSVNLRSLMNFLALRTTGHAQLEIRQYAEHIEALVQPFFPHVRLRDSV
jgi:thymidylate synthase (FAD)